MYSKYEQKEHQLSDAQKNAIVFSETSSLDPADQLQSQINTQSLHSQVGVQPPLQLADPARAREGRRVADVVHAEQHLDEAVESHTEASVWTRAKPPQIQIPTRNAATWRSKQHARDGYVLHSRKTSFLQNLCRSGKRHVLRL